MPLATINVTIASTKAPSLTQLYCSGFACTDVCGLRFADNGLRDSSFDDFGTLAAGKHVVTLQPTGEDQKLIGSPS